MNAAGEGPSEIDTPPAITILDKWETCTILLPAGYTPKGCKTMLSAFGIDVYVNDRLIILTWHRFKEAVYGDRFKAILADLSRNGAEIILT